MGARWSVFMKLKSHWTWCAHLRTFMSQGIVTTTFAFSMLGFSTRRSSPSLSQFYRTLQRLESWVVGISTLGSWRWRWLVAASTRRSSVFLVHHWVNHSFLIFSPWVWHQGIPTLAVSCGSDLPRMSPRQTLDECYSRTLYRCFVFFLGDGGQEWSKTGTFDFQGWSMILKTVTVGSTLLGGTRLCPSHFSTHRWSTHQICTRIHPFDPRALDCRCSSLLKGWSYVASLRITFVWPSSKNFLNGWMLGLKA